MGEGRQTLLALDPGKANGYAYGWFDSVTPITRLCAGIVGGGAQGLDDFLVAFVNEHGNPDHVVSELFVPDGGPGARETVSPRGEGVLISHFGESNIAWQKRSEKALGYHSQKQSDAKLKELGWWLTGASVGHEDARDANDAQLHLIQFVRKMRPRHLPTLRWLHGEAPAE